MERLILKGAIPMNCYLLTNENNECFIIDPGFFSQHIKKEVIKRGYNVVGILLTHAHFDHISGINCFDVPVYMHRAEEEIFNNRFINGSYFRDLETTKTFTLKDVFYVKDGDALPFGKNFVKVIGTPGHTIGSVCYKYKNDLYTGDTLFCRAVGRWDLITGKQEDLRDSIINLLESFVPETKIHPAHGVSSTIKDELNHNTYYLTWKKDQLIDGYQTGYGELFHKGRELLRDEKYIEAIEIFTTIIEKEPDNDIVQSYIMYCDEIVNSK